jgi:hypothetical protein
LSLGCFSAEKYFSLKIIGEVFWNKVWSYMLSSRQAGNAQRVLTANFN